MGLSRPLVRTELPRGETKGLTQPGAGGGAFDPVTAFFGAGEQGMIYDPSDLSTLWQDAGRTTPVTAAGQAVVVMDDISGNGNHATLTLCTLGVDGVGRYYIAPNGTSSTGVTSSVNFTATDKMTIWAGVQVGIAKTATIVKLGNAATLAGSFDYSTSGGGILLYRKGSGSFGGRGTTTIGTTATVSSATLDLSGATQATENPTLRTNLAQGSLTNSGSADSGGGNFGNHVVTLFSGQGFFSGRLYSLIVRGAMSTTDEITAGESWTVTKAGPPLPFSLTPTTFTDTGVATNAGTHYITSPFASVEIDTTATEIEVACQNLMYANFPTYCEIGVYVNGNYYDSIAPGSNINPFTDRMTLPAGSKRVSLVNGLQSRPGGTVLGTFQTMVAANAAITQDTTAPTNRVVIYGDSISVGANSLPATGAAWAMLVRKSYAPNSIAVEGFGFRALFDDCVDAAARTAFVAKIAAYAPSRIWLAIGTNDYGLSLWTAANFGTAYAALLDALNAALPSATIFAQTPLVRVVESNNAVGDPMSAYRSAIATAVSTRTAYTTLVDGTAILTLSDLDDSVHPSTAGHAIYAAAVETVLGI